MQHLYTLTDIAVIVANELIPRLVKHDIFTFVGPLGAGKTTIIKEFLKQCGVLDVVTSPTFGYVNIYQGHQGIIFHHFDLYRIKSLEDFIDAGFDELLTKPNSRSIIEWPEVIETLLEEAFVKKEICHIKLSYLQGAQDKRILSIHS